MAKTMTCFSFVEDDNLDEGCAGNPYLNVFSPDNDPVLLTICTNRGAWSVYFVFGEQNSVTAKMTNYNIACSKLF